MGCKASRQTVDPVSLAGPNQGSTNDDNGTGTDAAGVANSNDGNEYSELRGDIEVLLRPTPIALFERTGLDSPSPFSSRMIRNRLSSRMARIGGVDTEVDPYDEGDNLDRLRSEMITLERMFQTLLDSQRVGSPLTSNQTGYPPASTHTIENLPTIIVSEHDLEDGCNKECSIET